MPSANRRTTRCASSSMPHTHICPMPRSDSNASNQHFIIILTNNTDLIQSIQHFQNEIPTSSSSSSSAAAAAAATDAPHINQTDDMERERMLRNLLRHELRQATRDYLLRTRFRQTPLYHFIDMTDISPQQTNEDNEIDRSE